MTLTEYIPPADLVEGNQQWYARAKRHRPTVDYVCGIAQIEVPPDAHIGLFQNLEIEVSPKFYRANDRGSLTYFAILNGLSGQPFILDAYGKKLDLRETNNGAYWMVSVVLTSEQHDEARRLLYAPEEAGKP